MNTVDEIEAAISQLPAQDFVRLREWLLDQDSHRWDKQIEADCKSGKLDPLVQEVEEAIKQSSVKFLDEVLDGS